MQLQMAATVHFTFFHVYRRRPIQYAERIIDSCLRLQQPDGLFNFYGVGHSCFDADAIDLMLKASRFTKHRGDKVQDSLSRAAEALWTLANEDGGFAHCKIRFLRPFGLKLPGFISKGPAEGVYECPGKFLSCQSATSNGFSTWFRLMALAQAAPKDGKRRLFRRLPFLGYDP